MGVYYLWVCDQEREYFDPMDLPYYGNKWEAIPHSAWAVGVLALRRWHSPIRLVSDNGDEYYTLTRDDEASKADRGGDPPYTNVTSWALGAAIAAKAIPEEGLRCMSRDLLGLVKAKTLPIEVVEDELAKKYPDPPF